MTLNSISKLIIPCAHKMRIVLYRPQSLWPLENVKAGRLPITNQLYNHVRRTSHLTVSFSIAATVQRLLPAGVTRFLAGTLETKTEEGWRIRFLNCAGIFVGPNKVQMNATKIGSITAR